MKEVFYSPEDGGGTVDNKDKIELEKIKQEVGLIDSRNPNYEGVGIGIEITTKGFEGLNLDHHGKYSDSKTPSAIEQALVFDLKKIPEGKMATVKPDPDSLGAMAVLLLRKEGKMPEEKLVKAIGLLDRMGPGVFKDKGKELLNLAEDEFEDLSKKVRAIYYWVNVKNRNLPLEEKVLFMKKMLTNEISQKEIEELYKENEKDLEKVKKESKIEEIKPKEIVFIESKHLRSMEIGYEYGQVVIAYNPELKWPNGNVTPKYTIARYDNHVDFNMKKLLERLQKINPKWGGGENIISSPQGEDPKLSPEQIKDLVEEVYLENKVVSLMNLRKEIRDDIKYSRKPTEKIKEYFGLTENSTLGDLQKKLSILDSEIEEKEKRLKELRNKRELLEKSFS